MTGAGASFGALLTLFVAGLVTGWLMPRPSWQARRRPGSLVSRAETPEQSLARLSHRPGVRMGSGQALVANAPRPQVQREIPRPPPRGPIPPEHRVWR